MSNGGGIAGVVFGSGRARWERRLPIDATLRRRGVGVSGERRVVMPSCSVLARAVGNGRYICAWISDTKGEILQILVVPEIGMKD